VSPNPVLLSLLEHHASSFLNQINEQNLFSRKISTLLFEQLQEGVPGVDMVARELGMSIRSLQMKLKDEGITFSQIVENIRKELSKSYLAEKHYSIDDITYLLGFSDTSVFHRAFKRWTGQTPKQYRLNSKPSFKFG
jgi:AraC-like DNA-binding protein